MSMLTTLRRTCDALVGLFFPPHCSACQADTDAGVHLCAGCAEGARRIEAPFCRVCSQPFEGAITSEFICSNCGDRRFHFDCAVAPYLSHGVVRDFIHRFKYDGDYHLRHPLAEWAAVALDDERLRVQPYDAFIPVPLHRARKRERGFNQAEVLASLLARRTGTPLCNELQRTRYTTTQTRLDRHERMENLRGAFRVRQAAAVQRRHLILVDDVFTTGSTVEECARVLMQAGAASVRALTVARG
jgi:competence protein ComFC